MLNNYLLKLGVCFLLISCISSEMNSCGEQNNSPYNYINVQAEVEQAYHYWDFKVSVPLQWKDVSEKYRDDSRFLFGFRTNRNGYMQISRDTTNLNPTEFLVNLVDRNYGVKNIEFTEKSVYKLNCTEPISYSIGVHSKTCVVIFAIERDKYLYDFRIGFKDSSDVEMNFDNLQSIISSFQFNDSLMFDLDCGNN